MAEVRMDYEVVEAMAEGFQRSSTVLQAVSTALEAVCTALQAVSFIGGFGTMALERYLSDLQPRIERLAETCDEMQLDLLGAVTSLRDGDSEGSQRFI